MTGYFLIKSDNPQGTERIELGPQTLVGRSDECDLKVTDGHPSRRHAMLTVDARGLWVEDLESANGTRVNGAPITARTLLRSGDQVAFDLATFVVNCSPSVLDAGDATTVVGAPSASDATVVRPPPSALPQPGQSAEPQPTTHASKPGAQRFRAGALQKQVPRSWADPEYHGEGTRILSPDEIRALAASGGSAQGTPGDAPAPTSVEGPHLVILAGPETGTAFPLSPGRSEWTIGTAPERDVRLDYPGVSAFHAKINEESGRWRIIDQMSANGTWINGQKSTISYLQNGDRLRFARVECEIRLPPADRPLLNSAPRRVSRLQPMLIAGGSALLTAVLLYAAAQFL